MVLTRFVSGENGASSIVMANFDLILLNQALQALNDASTIYFENFIFDEFTDETKIDTTNTDAAYAGGSSSGGTWFCTQYDQFDDSSISATKWTTATTSGAPNGSGTVTESGTQILLSADSPSSGSNDASATLTSDGSSGLDMKGQDGEIVFHGTASAIADGSVNVKVLIGNTLVYTLITGTTTSITADWRLVFNNSAETVDLYQDGVAIATDVDISTEANWYVEFYVDSSSGDGSRSLATWRLNTIGYVKDGDSNSVNFVTATDTASETVNSLFIYHDADGTTTVNGSVNSGSTYTALTNKKTTRISNTGTGIKYKFTQTVPSITNTTTNIKKISKLGGFY